MVRECTDNLYLSSKLIKVGRIWFEKTKLLTAAAAHRKSSSRERYWTQPHFRTCQNPGR